MPQGREVQKKPCLQDRRRSEKFLVVVAFWVAKLRSDRVTDVAALSTVVGCFWREWKISKCVDHSELEPAASCDGYDVTCM